MRASSGDKLVRYGGEEFLIVVRGGVRSAERLMGRINKEIQEAKIPHEASLVTRKDNSEEKIEIVTISAGIASLNQCGPNPTPEELIGLADAALYEAKKAGRNRFLVSKLPSTGLAQDAASVTGVNPTIAAAPEVAV